MKPLRAPVLWTAAALLVAASVLIPQAADAQLRFTPRVGLYAPLGDLGQVDSGSDAVELGERESTLAFGLGIELGDGSGTAFRLDGFYATESEVPVEGVGCAPGECSPRSTLAAVTGSVVLRPLPSLAVVHPYLLAGGGLKRYDFEEEDLRAEGLDAFVSDQNQWAGHVGLGAEVRLGVVRAVVELSDLFGPFEGEDDGGDFQHDLFLTIGIVVGG